MDHLKIFFFFFQSKPWPPVYLDGCYNYPNPESYRFLNYSDFRFIYGTQNDSSNNELLDNTKQKLSLFFKIPPRLFINRNYNSYQEGSNNFIPDYNKINIQFRESTIDNGINNLITQSFQNLINDDIMITDPSRNQNYSNDLSINYIINISRAIAQTDSTISSLIKF